MALTAERVAEFLNHRGDERAQKAVDRYRTKTSKQLAKKLGLDE